MASDFRVKIAMQGLSKCEFEEVLFRQKEMFFGQAIIGDKHVLDHVVACHAVSFGKSEIAGPAVGIEVDDGNPVAGFQGGPQVEEVGGPVLQVMIGVADKNQIDGFGRKRRVIWPG